MSDEEQQSKTRPPTTVSTQQTLVSDEPKVGKPVDVNSNLTPITRKEIKPVNSDNWKDLNLHHLHEQLSVLEQRLAYAQQIGHEEMIQQLSRGIIQLHAHIQAKTPKDIRLI